MNRPLIFAVIALNALSLSGATVTYFEKHTSERVKWQAWGTAAFDRARKEDKPIALVVGSFAPHSSRVAHQAIEADSAVVSTLNGRFVPVLLDRAEWPGVAAAYAAASDRRDSADVVMYALTPDLEWLENARLSSLSAIADRWKNDRAAFLDESRLKVRRMRIRLAAETPARTSDLSAGRLRALDRSSRHDALGGGFFRADSVFDKNLSDQARLASEFRQAAQLTGDARFAEVARNTLEFAVRDLQMRSGAFNDSQEADSLVAVDGKPQIVDGAYYLWDPSEIMHVFGPKIGRQLCDRFGIVAPRSLPRLVRSGTPDDALARAIAKLLDIRLKRPMPLRDDPVLESSALMISSLAQSDDDRYIRAALLGASFIQRSLFDRKTGRLWRRPGIPATAADSAALVDASIELYEATLDTKWLDFAIDMQERKMLQEPGTEVPEAVRDFVATAPAPANLTRLAAITGREELKPGMTRVIIFGATYRSDTIALLRAARSSFDPMRVVVHGGDAKHRPSSRVRIGSLQPLADGTAAAHICRAAGCSDAITSPEALAAALK